MIELTDRYFLLTLEYRHYLSHRNYSTRTVKEYPDAIAHFLKYLEEKEIHDPKDISLKDLQSYQYTFHPLAVKTQRTKINRVKNFFAYLYKTEKIYQNLSHDLEVPRLPKTLPRGLLEPHEIEALLAQPDPLTYIGARDKAILELFYSSALRNAELRGLTLSSLDLYGRGLQVMGKGRKEALVPFGYPAKEAMEYYIKQWRPVVKSKEPWLFLSYTGKKLSGHTVGDIVRRYVKEAGIDKKCTPHGLRHSCATYLLRNGADIRHIQELLRHTDLSSTQIYTRVDITDLREAQQKYHPRERGNNE